MAINSTSAAKHGQCLSETSSRCVTESVTATHNFEVTGFSLLDGMGVGKCVSSSTFSVGGYDCYINVYPDGINKQEDNSAYVSVFLYFRSGAVGARVNFSLSLLDRDGEVSKLRGFVSMFQHTFPAVGGDWGKIKFIKKSDLQACSDCCLSTMTTSQSALCFHSTTSTRSSFCPTPTYSALAMAINSTSAVKHGQILPETWSRCVTGSVTAAHNFEVTNFSQLDGMGAGKFVSSSTFSVGGYDWRVDFYPDGNSKEDRGVYVSAFLYFLRGIDGVTVELSLSLLGKDNQVSKEKTDRRTFPAVGSDWGWSNFIEKSKLKELLRLNGDRFTIRCVLTLIDAPHTEGGSAIEIPQPKLHQDLTVMLKNGEGADVTFSVRDQLFSAHKCILAMRSTVFKAELFGAMKEKDTQCIKIDDMEPTHAQYLSRTTSRCVTGSVTAMHEFVVTNFSLIEGMANGKFVSSATFSVGGRDWNIRLYPDGSRTEDKGCISVALYFLKGEGAIRARVKFSLSLFLVDNKVEQVCETVTAYTFNSKEDNRGWYQFIEKSKLQELLPPEDDSFTLKCVLTLMDDPHTEDASISTVTVPQSKLHQDLTHMLKNGEDADVTFSVGGQQFPAHKCMLAARSMVFKAEFFSAMKEKDAHYIKNDDMEPTIFEALLHFVYTDSLPDVCYAADSSNVAMQHLLVAADRYGLDRLRLMCEAKLCQDIDVQTVATTIVLAEQHHCTQLKDACLGFIASRNMLGVVMKTDGFKHLITSCPLVMKEILERVAAVGNE
ncbi:unnamed protein product [Urochloa decumbens]|uniref:Uncharacterized protein n=1 Tax=Urochloa decumbens TaxID=240449 RepID=A0ABC9D1H1_9POAL